MVTVTHKKIGFSRYGDIKWEAISNLELSIQQLADLQSKEGYEYTGYGFYGPRKFRRRYADGSVNYRYTWVCSTTCD